MTVRVPLLLVVVLCRTAGAQPRATEAPRRWRHPHAGFGGDLVFGWAGQHDGPSGWVARLEYELFPVFTPRGVGPVVGVQPGFEVWRSGADHWGGSLPLALVLGVRAFPIRATVGVGIDAFLIDQVDDDTGFGMYAPFALAKLGLDVRGWQLGADARIGYRWQLGAPDQTRWQLGIFIGKTMVSPVDPRAPIR